ncbi:MAG: GTPase KRas precursor [Candidatus Heimdallarchaeota archaeon LC_2]|nr:MAG: GTPase KRas precursor [Candidatus Heimdallarchaeota archaeon LC_2]
MISSTTFKIIMVGDAMVGKTTLRLRYMGEGFREKYIPTIGVDFAIATYQNYILQIWDLAGQQTFNSMIEKMYLGATGIIVVFDVTNKKTMLNVPNWIDAFLTIERKAVPMVVFGNKVDLRDESSIQKLEAEEYVNNLSKKYEVEVNYVETSALTGENIKSAFEGFVDRIAAEQQLTF